jgi:RNA polymerase sigma-70 factor, ECF subfamily
VIAENPGFEIRMGTLNGEMAYIAYDGDAPDTVAFLKSDDGLISELYLIRNPDKLEHVR